MIKTLLSVSACSLSTYYGLKTIKTTNSNENILSAQRNAICILYPDNNSGVSGLVSFS